jgi:hypothetical protein
LDIRTLKIYHITPLKKCVNEIKTHNIPQLNKWADILLECAYHGNQEAFKAMISKFL